MIPHGLVFELLIRGAAAGVGALGWMTYAAATPDWIVHLDATGKADSAGQETLLLPLLFTGTTAAVIGFAFLAPSTSALISRRTDADRQGEVLGVNQSAAALARIVGPVLALTLYESTENATVSRASKPMNILIKMRPPPTARSRAQGVQCAAGS